MVGIGIFQQADLNQTITRQLVLVLVEEAEEHRCARGTHGSWLVVDLADDKCSCRTEQASAQITKHCPDSGIATLI